MDSSTVQKKLAEAMRLEEEITIEKKDKVTIQGKPVFAESGRIKGKSVEWTIRDSYKNEEKVFIEDVKSIF